MTGSEPGSGTARKLRIVVVGAYFFPEPIGIGKYSGEMARWLAAEGNEVHMVTAPPHYPGWAVQAPYAAHRYAKEQLVPGLTVWRCPIFEPNPPSGLRRLIYQLSLAASSIPVMFYLTLRRPHVMIVATPPLLSATVVRLFAYLCGAKTWLHAQDLEVDAAFDLGLLKGERLRRTALWFERTLLRRFDRVSTISTKMRERVVAKGVDSGRVTLLENWVDIDNIRPIASETIFRTQLGLDTGQKVVLYSGNLGDKQGLDILVDAAKTLKNRRDILFLIAGEGPAKERLVMRSGGLDNVRFMPLQPVERLGELLGTADIHALPQLAVATDLVMPSKLGGMFASGRPVVAATAPDSQVAHEVREAGLVVPPEDAAAFADAVVRLADDDLLRETLGAKARKLAETRLAINAILPRFGSDLQSLARP